MHTITVQVKDGMYEHFLYLLKNLNSKEIKVIDEKLSEPNITLKSELKELFSSSDITAFKVISDPVAWQKEQRDEW